MSYSIRFSCLLLVAGVGPAAARPGQVEVQANTQACVIGRPVSVVFRVARPAGAAVSWRLVDQAFSSVTLLKAETRAWPSDSSRHEVIFTATRGGRCQLGPFWVVVQRPQRTDTLTASAIRVQFRAEALRPALHPLQPNATVWQAMENAQPGIWAIASLLLLGAGVGAGWLWRAQQGVAIAEVAALSPAQAQQQALTRIADLERANQLQNYSQENLPDQLWSIINEYVAQQPALSAEGAPLRAALLAELAQAKYAPARETPHHASGLLAKARQLVVSEADPTNPLSQPL